MLLYHTQAKRRLERPAANIIVVTTGMHYNKAPYALGIAKIVDSIRLLYISKQKGATGMTRK